jgi:hypothetical protein
MVFADTTFGPATKLTVKIQEPEMSPTVSVSRLKSWLDGVGKSPGEHALKSKLRQLVWSPPLIASAILLYTCSYFLVTAHVFSPGTSKPEDDLAVFLGPERCAPAP